MYDNEKDHLDLSSRLHSKFNDFEKGRKKKLNEWDKLKK
jgi:hypothetical protein